MRSEASTVAGLDQRLLAILACPQCKGKLQYDTQRPALECGRCRLRYLIRNGIPILLPSEAEVMPTATY
ncbi:MAG: Trm112 family protein [candidate division Zixibacteria bacterium]|nr:Trm112 family protein [candidate division Zixibacteria bacterium]